MRLIFYTSIFIFVSTLYSFAQQKEWGIEVNPKVGFLLAHRGVMGHLGKEHAIGGEITGFIQTNGSKNYHQHYNYPKVGVTLFGSTVGNNKLLGQVYGSYIFIDFPFAKNQRNEFSGRISAGGSWNTKIFDQESNPKGIAMSTHFNALICLGFRYRYFIGNSHLLAGIDLTHCSNGSTKVPNLGINLPYVTLGFGKTIQRSERIKNTTEFEKKRWNVTAIGILSVKEIFPTGGRKYPVYALSVLGRKITGPKSGIETGLDFIYKTSIKGYKPEIPKTDASIAQLGVYCGYILPLDKLQFVLGMGGYLVDKYNPDNALYHRLGMRYQANKHLMINFTLKTHWAKADYVEYGIGYTF